MACASRGLNDLRHAAMATNCGHCAMRWEDPPFRQDMHGERSLVSFGSLFEPASVLLEVSVRERAEGASHSLFSFATFLLDRVRALGDGAPHVDRFLTGLGKRQVRIGAQRRPRKSV
jgi:hypothetical protein